MYNHHNFPKALVMTRFKILQLTTAANFIYTAKRVLLFYIFVPTDSNSSLTSSFPLFHSCKTFSTVAILKSTNGFCILQKTCLSDHLTVCSDQTWRGFLTRNDYIQSQCKYANWLSGRRTPIGYSGRIFASCKIHQKRSSCRIRTSNMTRKS